MITGRNVKVDITINYFSFFIIASSGLILNFILAKLYPPEVFGAFNQAYAVYIIFSQLCVLGVHHSTQKHIAHSFDDYHINTQIILSAMAVTLLLSVVSFCILMLIKDYIGIMLHSQDTASSLIFISYSLLFFGINKVALSALNGLHKMISFAVFQSIRYILVILGVFILYYNNAPTTYLTASFLFAEVLLFLIIVIYFLTVKRIPISPDSSLIKIWTRKHLFFGIKGAMSAILVELNTRVDVIILGIFTTDGNVGIYSLASCFAEGFYQAFIVIKNYVNPLISNLHFNKNLKVFFMLKKTIIKYCYLGSVIAGIISIPVISFITTNVLHLDVAYNQTQILFAIIASGILISAGFIPFNDILLQTGHPGHHSFSIILTVLLNVILCFIMVPLFGLYGAAVAVAISIIFNIIVVNYFIIRLESINLFSRY